MNKCFYVIIGLLFFNLIVSCQNCVNKKDDVVTVKNQRKEILDNLNEEICESDFEKFFIFFSSDSIYQKKHITFPLKYSSYDENEEIVVEKIKNETAFKYINFTKDKAAINNEIDKFSIEKDVKENSSVYKRVGIDNGIYITYEFKKYNNCWYLTSIIDESI